MLDIKNLSASVDGKKILEGFDLKIKSGEVHAIMGVTQIILIGA